MQATLNGRCTIFFSVDTMASKSVVTARTLDNLRLWMPVASQRLKPPVKFQLADDSEWSREIAYMDFYIATESTTIKLQAVPLFVLPGPKGDVLLGKAQHEELGIISTKRLLALAASQLTGVVTVRDPFDVNGELLIAAGPPAQKLMWLILVANDGKVKEEELKTEEESDEEDLPEEGLIEENLRRDNF